MRFGVLYLATGVVFAACSGPRTVGITNRAAISNRVSGQVAVWARARNNRSLDTLALLYEPRRDLRSVWPDGTILQGWTAVSARWKAWLDSASQLNVVVGNPEVEALAPQAAVSSFTATTDVVAGGARRRESQRVTQVWRLDEEGRWRIAVEHRSSLPPALP